MNINFIESAGMGMIGCSIFCTSALLLWYGVKLIIEDNYDNGIVVSVSFQVS